MIMLAKKIVTCVNSASVCDTDLFMPSDFIKAVLSSSVISDISFPDSSYYLAHKYYLQSNPVRLIKTGL